MKKSTIIILGIIIAIIMFLLTMPRAGPYDSFADCISKSGAIMYGTDWCPHCKAQKKMFGNSFRKINYINCDVEKNKCLVQGISGYPTWDIGGKKYEGTQPLEKLSVLTGCSIKK
ncbi:MAG: hypothetical protein D6734_12750 [Candidatus Schekmanbacteria bacterium]|nr:MAG: hypothetical protein D6734_12750 [Candidatus Schekmanbacteria bacterium]